MKTLEISISKNRAAVTLETGKTIQFVIWDLEESKHKSLENQLNLAFGICSTFSEIEKHLKVNGFDAELEDIFLN